MDSLYTSEVQETLARAPWPKSFQWVITETSNGLYFVMYKQNFMNLSHDDKVTVNRLVNERFKRINDSGIPLSLQLKEGYRPNKGV